MKRWWIPALSLVAAMVCRPGHAAAATAEVEVSCVLGDAASCVFVNIGSVPASGCASVSILGVDGAWAEVCSEALEPEERQTLEVSFTGIDLAESCATGLSCQLLITDTEARIEGWRKWFGWLKWGLIGAAVVGLIASSMYWQRKTRRLFEAGYKNRAPGDDGD